MAEFHIPIYIEDEGWGYIDFDTRNEFSEYLKSIVREPGEMGFNQFTKENFNKQAQKFEEKGYYCAAPKGSIDYIKYWDAEKEKSTKGCFFRDKNNTT